MPTTPHQRKLFRNHNFIKNQNQTTELANTINRFRDIDSAAINLTLTQTLTQTLTLGLSLGLGLAWGHFQNKNFFVYPSFKDFSLKVYDDTNLLHLVSDTQRFSFSQELTPTLTLG